MKIKLIDGKELEIEQGKTGLEVAQSISMSLAKASIAFALDNKLYDLNQVIPHEGLFTLIKKDDPRSYDVLNHSTSHLLAEAVSNLYPNAKFGFGPSIEEGFYYDIDFGDDKVTEVDFPAIEKEMKRLSASGNKFIRTVVSKQEALEIFKDNPYKIELIEGIDDEITIYSQGKFVDLCAGPHVEKVSQIQHFKLLSVAGAYWRGDVKNKMLTRIYGTSFWSQEELQKHLNDLEERKKRDHRRLGKELNLFMMSEYGPGFPFWLPNGMVLRKTLENFWYDIHTKNGYLFVQTPIMLNKELWEISGHWYNYKENMYTSEIDEKEYAIKPMNCPGGMLVYKNDIHSYRDFPLRIGELGLVHRHEASGALNGLFRVRTFTQDDAHIFITEDQIEEEISRLIDLYDYVYSVFGLSYHIELSTRPENKYIGEIATWDKAEKALASAMEKKGIKYILNPGDGAFYGPKLDFKLRDSMNRIWQCGTIQLDMNLPERFDLTYVSETSEKKRPIMLHRALFGSIERFIAIIIEHFAGAFPTWLAPTQLKLLPVAPVHNDKAYEYKKYFEELGIRCMVDDREEKLGYRMREAQVTKTPYTLVIGDKECEETSVTYRKYATREQISVTLEEFKEKLLKEIKEKELLVK